MIRAWLERHGWTWVREDVDDDLYTKGSPVCINTAAALFSEATDIEAQLDRVYEAISPGRQNVGEYYYVSVVQKMRERETQIIALENHPLCYHDSQYFCTRAAGHAVPCNGLPRETCEVSGR